MSSKISTPVPVPPRVFLSLRQARLAPSRGGAVQQLAAVLRIKASWRLRCCALLFADTGRAGARTSRSSPCWNEWRVPAPPLVPQSRPSDVHKAQQLATAVLRASSSTERWSRGDSCPSRLRRCVSGGCLLNRGFSDCPSARQLCSKLLKISTKILALSSGLLRARRRRISPGPTG
jgi:hypothetical protein